MAYDPPNANGQATMANSSPVVIASDQSAIPVYASGSTGPPTGLTVPSGPTNLVTGTFANGATVLAAPGSGAYYVFGWDCGALTLADAVFLVTGGVVFSALQVPAAPAAGQGWVSSGPLGPMRIPTSITIAHQTNAANSGLILRYAPGP